MRRSTAILSVFLAGAMGVTTYSIKQRVLSLEGELRVLNRQIFALQESSNLLKAEWGYLNNPQRLKELAVRYLPSLVSGRGLQIVTFEMLEEPEGDKPQGSAFMALAGLKEE